MKSFKRALVSRAVAFGVLCIVAAGCSTAPELPAARLDLTLEQSVVQARGKLYVLAANPEQVTVFIDPRSFRLQRRNGARWQAVNGLASDGLPGVDRAVGVGPGSSRSLAVVLNDHLLPAQYRLAFEVYTESVDTRPATVATSTFTVRE